MGIEKKESFDLTLDWTILIQGRTLVCSQAKCEL